MVRNSKASRSFCTLAIFRLVVREKMWSKKCRIRELACVWFGVFDRLSLGAPGQLILPQQRPTSASHHPGIAPSSTAHPFRVSKPTQEPEKISPTGFEHISSFLLCYSFSRAVGVSGLQHVVSVLTVRLLLDTFPLLRNNSPRLTMYN